jgi:acyl-CoA thioester hydrolase
VTNLSDRCPRPSDQAGGPRSERAPADRRAAYPYFARITTRWEDNDVYAHVNNVVYYSFFDTAVNELLIRRGVLDIRRSPVIGFVVETRCQFFAPLAFPDRIDVGIRVARVGSSSVRYEIGIFRNDDEMAAAQGHFVHVYVDRASNRPVPALPEALREVLRPLLVAG